MARAADRPVMLGLRANAGQFTLLVLVNALVGAMVGLERVVVPLLGQDVFHLSSTGATAGFIVTFGLSKALTNLMAGRLAERFGRRRVLVAGWLAGVPVAPLIIWAPSWGWVLLANAFLGVNQGLAWSMTVNMKVDLVGPRRRGLALGLNEFAGYVAVAMAAVASGLVAERFGLRPAPFYLGIGFAALGLGTSILLVRDTSAHVALEHALRQAPPTAPSPAAERPPSLARMFALVSLRDRTLSACSQAGLVNNLNDGLAWGIFPLYFAAAGLDVARIGVIAAAYPWTWGVLQLVTGALSDRLGRKWLIAGGMWLQAAAILSVALMDGFAPWTVAAVVMGAGTAMVYPTLLAAVSDVAPPTQRATALGVYRFWRDAGFAAGALGAGLLADVASTGTSIVAVAALTGLSGVVVAVRMTETVPPGHRHQLTGPPRLAPGSSTLAGGTKASTRR
jgi:MFS family permease